MLYYDELKVVQNDISDNSQYYVIFSWRDNVEKKVIMKWIYHEKTKLLNDG